MDDIIHQLLEDIIENTLKQLRGGEHEDYMELTVDKAFLTQKLGEMLAGLSDSDRATFEQYQDICYRIWGIERTAIYQQAFRDAFQLMKWIRE